MWRKSNRHREKGGWESISSTFLRSIPFVHRSRWLHFVLPTVWVRWYRVLFCLGGVADYPQGVYLFDMSRFEWDSAVMFGIRTLSAFRAYGQIPNVNDTTKNHDKSPLNTPSPPSLPTAYSCNTNTTPPFNKYSPPRHHKP